MLALWGPGAEEIMKGFFIEITNNLLDPKHRKKMGTAVWEFMWCLDKITKIDEEQVGWVYGGKPINLKDISKEIGIAEPNVSKNLNKLEKQGYLELKHTTHGIVIKVWKAQKRFNKKIARFNDKVMRFNDKIKPNIRQYSDIYKDNNEKVFSTAGFKSAKEIMAEKLK